MLEVKSLNRMILFFVGALALYVFSFGLTPSGFTIQISQATEGSIHPKDWDTSHGKDYLKGSDACKACHGEDLGGADTGIACDMCHLSPKHPTGWDKSHGKKYVEDSTTCSTCHGATLDGADTEIACNMCHLSPKHPSDWLGKHWGEFYKDKAQCETCHGKPLFNDIKKPSNVTCTRCHSVNQDISKWQAESHTSSFSINFSNDTQFSEDRFNNREFVSNHYLGFHLSERSKQMSFTSQMRYSREWVGDTQDIDIYEFNFEVDNLFKNALTLNLGRLPYISNIDYYVADGMSMTITPIKWFDVYLFAGVPRYVEDSDITGNVGLATGASLILKERAYTNARIDFVYQDRDLNNSSITDDPAMYLGASASKGISIFKLYGLGEYNLSDQLFQTGTAGVEIYPFSQRVGFLVEGSYFDESRNDTQETIFELLSVDYLWQAKSGVFVDVVKDLHLYQNLSFQRYEVLAGSMRNGWNAETGAAYSFNKIHLDTEVAYYLLRSYGGTLHGVRLFLNEDWTERIFSNVLVDLITYSKVTNDDSTGMDVQLTAGVHVLPGLRVAGSFEYLRNDIFKNDLRGILRLDYMFNTRFLEIDRREKKTEKKQ